ncbi:MAG: hypothetical protein D6737_04400 [Chloroflexi bacterium]|nr:MAG: hypothetical protein CUN54_07480 [Phototrophicales bacterium]RMF81637.1 MAG: hypothetical protein D6737_04400 [Chloroflexota bacterium]
MSIDSLGTTPLIIIACVLLCGVGIVLFFALQIISTIGDIIGVFADLIGFALDILSGGPVAWCGCLFVIFACIIGIVVIVLTIDALTACGTPDATNLCTLFGR